MFIASQNAICATQDTVTMALRTTALHVHQVRILLLVQQRARFPVRRGRAWSPVHLRSPPVLRLAAHATPHMPTMALPFTAKLVP